ncbi:transcriptional regulator STERILE APETALA [Eutrema salsugineum]|uniref:transcriptional regulator STERILE APETALA n=1 Tax=Eutrema salsugineum TaxID=72664 RepID=UPI000CED035E|nr:transcriptional regulator STERILE APETALA [Eutrema salsugineum]
MSSSSSSSENGDSGGGSTFGARRTGGVFEAPSPSRPRYGANDVWPEPFLESLAVQVAVDASLSSGLLSAAPALANVFRVCTTWQAVSRSDHLWQLLCRQVWTRTSLMHDTWREEFMYRHRTARNFRTRNNIHFTLNFDPSDVDEPDSLSCRCLTLSDRYLAAGFADGTVRLFLLNNRLHVRTLRPPLRDRFGRFSRAVSGIVISDSRLVFATMDGDIHVAAMDGIGGHTRTAYAGDIVNDGALVDFTGCGRYWVGLFAGVPGRAFHIWDCNSEETTFVGGSLTDPEAVMGWHTLTELTTSLGRLRISGGETAVACTRWRIMVIDLRNQGVIIGEDEEQRRGLIVTGFDANDEAYVRMDGRGNAIVRRTRTQETVCEFRVSGAAQRRVMGCVNRLHALMCAGGVVRVWEVERGEYVYSFRERVGEVDAIVADDRHVAVASSSSTGVSTIHLWDFGAL